MDNLMVYLILGICIVVLIYYLIAKKEAFILAPNAEFRGLNMFGLNSVDSHFPATSEAECQKFCADAEHCKGYSFYWPGQRCYVFASGGFVPDRPGYLSGMKN
jgi:hypothetical protein